MLINSQLDTGYESSSGFRDALTKILGEVPSKGKSKTLLCAAWLDTKLGLMLCITDGKSLLLLEFIHRRGLEREVERLRKRLNAAIVPGEDSVTQMIREEVALYFAGNLDVFKTPFRLLGSDFQQRVWQELIKIPYGTTISYETLACRIGKPTAFRAVANANGANQLALLIPCHRVINKNGAIGGYAGGIAIKQWLLKLETEKSAI